ncbi:MAG TPA: helix-turn-helix transcriptional regulator [Chitinophagaceae bacterium]|jgi:transcriptional regulator with XRE-family HTH domain|nr:helix-turn-helix transcriptional regulator [Chitinophagaceae bacterium]
MPEQLTLAVRKAIGEKVRLVRQKQGYSLRELEALTGFGHSWLAKVEKGQINLQIDSLIGLMEALHIQMKDIFSSRLSLPEE